MAFDITGKLHKKYDEETKGASFRVREFVIHTDNEQYPQFIKFQLTQDRCDLVSQYEVGNSIKVHFDLRGREWQDKYFTNLNAWRIENGDATATASAQDNSTTSSTPSSNNAAPAPSINDMPSQVEDQMDDLPF